MKTKGERLTIRLAGLAEIQEDQPEDWVGAEAHG